MRKLFLIPLLCAMAFGQTVLGGTAKIGGVATFGSAVASGTTFGFVRIVAIGGGGGSGCPATTGTTCTFTVPATGSGNVGIIYTAVGQVSTLATSVSGGGTWTCPAGAGISYTAGTMSLSGCYNLNLTGSVTSIVITYGATLSNYPEVFYLECTQSGTAASYNTSRSESRNGASPLAGEDLTGASPVFTASNSIIVQAVAYAGSTPTGITGGSPAYGHFQTPMPLTNMSIADSENTTTGTAPSWTYGSSSFGAFSALAIQ